MPVSLDRAVNAFLAKEPRRAGCGLTRKKGPTHDRSLQGRAAALPPGAIAAFLANLVVLGFLSRMVDMAQQPIFVYQIFAAVYAVAGALLGLYQMGSYRKAQPVAQPAAPADAPAADRGA